MTRRAKGRCEAPWRISVRRVAIWVITGVTTQGCGDPVVVVGDLPGIMRVVAGVSPDANPSSSTDATRLELLGPRGLAVTEAGTLYVVDGPARSVLEIQPAGDSRRVFDHRACIGPICIRRPESIALDGRGGALISDPSGGRIWRVPLSPGSVELVAGSPDGEEPRPGGVAATTTFAEPSGVVAHPDGAVYLAERGGHRVWRVETTGILTLVAGTGFLGDRDGVASLAQFRAPAGLFLHGTTLFVADQGNHRVRAIDLERGTVSTVAGTGIAAFSGDGGPARLASLKSPESVTVTADGVTMFIADKGNHRIRRVLLPTGVIRTFAGTGDPVFTGSGREAGTTALSSPAGVTSLAGNSFIFMADNGNRLVWRTPVGP